MWGLAKSLDINTLHTSDVQISPQLTIIETDLTLKRKYDKDKNILGELVKDISPKKVKNILKRKMSKNIFTQEYVNRKLDTNLNFHKNYLKRVASLILKKPLSIYISPEFDLNINRRLRISCAIPLLKHYLKIINAKNFYKLNSTENLPNQNSVVLFLHAQPEAAVIPQGLFLRSITYFRFDFRSFA